MGKLSDNPKVLRDTGGHWDYDDEYTCYCCGEEMDEDDAIYCEGYDNYYCRDCIVYDYADEPVPSDHAIEVHVDDDVVWVDEEMIGEVAISINNKWYLKPDQGHDSAIMFKNELDEEEIKELLDEGWEEADSDMLYKPQ